LFLILISYYCSGWVTIGGSVGPASALVSSLGASAPSFGASAPSFGASAPSFGASSFFGSSFFGAGVVIGEALIGIFSSSYHS